MSRASTARLAMGASYFSVLADEIPSGICLNLGSGLTSVSRPDLDLVNIDHAMPKVRVEPPFVLGDALALPFADGVFDAVLAKDVIEHLADPIAALREVHRTARPGASLIATVPRAIARAVWDDPTHVRGFTSRAVRLALELSGWRLDRINRIGGFPGAGRLGLLYHLETVMAVPVLGHWFGTNWLIRATAMKKSSH